MPSQYIIIIGTRLLGDCKSNSPNNLKITMGIFSNTSYWERVIGELLESGDALRTLLFTSIPKISYWNVFRHSYRCSYSK